MLHLERVKEHFDQNRNDDIFQSNSGPLFDPDDEALLEFLVPKSGGGVRILRPHRIYHDSKATDVVNNIIQQMDEGYTVILDLGNAPDEIRRYFSDLLSRAVFSRQEEKFTSNNFDGHFRTFIFEEAHNLFPPDSKDLTGVYARFAKEGANFISV